ncbi:MAG: efflux transporter outer membrane subunit [Thermoanaerobaculia bacterium]
MRRIAVRFRRWTPLSAVLVLSACTTLGPDYQEPDVAWLHDWQPDLYGQIADSEQQSELDLQFWWHLFDDSILNELIETAKQENPSLRIAGLNILASRAQLGIATSNRYPQSQQASADVAYVNTQQSGGVVSNDQDLTSYQAGFGIGWELDFWGRFQRGIESADAAFFASIANQQDAQVLLSATVTSLYFTYRTTLLQIEVAKRNADIQKRSFDITRQLFEDGQSSELDLQQAKTQYLATLATVPSLEAALVQTSNALGALLGRAPGDMPEIKGLTGKLPAVEPLLVEAVPARLLLRRPDIRAAAWQVAAQSAQIGIAEADFYPAITLLGSIGWSGNSLSASPDTGTLAVGPSVTWNLFDHGRIRNNVRLQDALLQQAIENFQNSALQAAREIDDAAISVLKTGERQKLLVEAANAAQRSLDLANKLFNEGYANFNRVLDAQRSLFAQTQNEITNQSDHISAVIDLYKSLGGGWLDTPVEQLLPQAIRDTMQERSDWGDLLNAPLPAPTQQPLPGSENSR